MARACGRQGALPRAAARGAHGVSAVQLQTATRPLDHAFQSRISTVRSRQRRDSERRLTTTFPDYPRRWLEPSLPVLSTPTQSVSSPSNPARPSQNWADRRISNIFG